MSSDEGSLSLGSDSDGSDWAEEPPAVTSDDEDGDSPLAAVSTFTNRKAKVLKPRNFTSTHRLTGSTEIICILSTADGANTPGAVDPAVTHARIVDCSNDAVVYYGYVVADTPTTPKELVLAGAYKFIFCNTVTDHKRVRTRWTSVKGAAKYTPEIRGLLLRASGPSPDAEAIATLKKDHAKAFAAMTTPPFSQLTYAAEARKTASGGTASKKTVPPKPAAPVKNSPKPKPKQEPPRQGKPAADKDKPEKPAKKRPATAAPAQPAKRSKPSATVTPAAPAKPAKPAEAESTATTYDVTVTVRNAPASVVASLLGAQ